MIPPYQFYDNYTLFNRRLNKQFESKSFKFELHLFLLSWIRNFQKGEELKYFKRYISTI